LNFPGAWGIRCSWCGFVGTLANSLIYIGMALEGVKTERSLWFSSGRACLLLGSRAERLCLLVVRHSAFCLSRASLLQRGLSLPLCSWDGEPAIFFDGFYGGICHFLVGSWFLAAYCWAYGYGHLRLQIRYSSFIGNSMQIEL
jgi:hypothetical protein